MQNQRLLIWVTFGMMLWLTYQAWVQDYAPRPEPAGAPVSTEPGQPTPPDADPSLPALPETELGDADAPQIIDDAPALDDTRQAADADADPAGQVVTVLTDVLDLEFSTRGATLISARVRNYPVDKDNPDVVVSLLNPGGPDYAVIQTGLRADGAGAEPNHLAEFETPAARYDLGSAEELVIPFRWRNDAGVTVEKTFRLRRGSYRIDLEQRVTNGSDALWRGAEYAQIHRRSAEQERSMFDVDSYSFDGPIIYDGEKSEKLDRDDLLDDGPLALRAEGGWIGSIQHHFVRALVPPRNEEYRYSIAVRGDRATLSLIGPAIIVPSDSEHTFDTTLFVGPKLQDQLEEVAESLKLTVDYGWLTIISQPLFWLMSWVHSFVANWGVAIIIVTILIKLVFYKLTEASGRSMAKMREIQPRMKALQERYKDDRQALSQQMMELYKREKVNPAAGCLPILIQMPFFLAFYWVLLESVEMRQAPFALWITDLSSRDPYFILPIIMGAAMLFQQKLNPAPADPVQAKVMQIMPIIFTVFFAFFPSGLVLYWVTNTVLSIAQQWYINKVVHEEATARKGGGKKKKDKAQS